MPQGLSDALLASLVGCSWHDFKADISCPATLVGLPATPWRSLGLQPLCTGHFSEQSPFPQHTLGFTCPVLSLLTSVLSLFKPH